MKHKAQKKDLTEYQNSISQDIFEENINIHNMSSQQLANNQRRHSRDEKFLQFVVRLLTTDHNLSLYENKNPESFVYIDKITSPIFQETRDQLQKILSLGLIRNLFVYRKGYQKIPFPQRTIIKRDPSNKKEQDIHQQDIEEQNIEYLDILDYPPLSFSDISIELLSQLFNHRSLNIFISQQKRSKKNTDWSNLCNGDILLMFQLYEVLQHDSSHMIFVDPLSLYVHGNHPLYQENKYRSQIRQEQHEVQRIHRKQMQQEGLPFLPYSYQDIKSRKARPEDFYEEQQNSRIRGYLQNASMRLFQDDIRPFVMLLFQNNTFVPEIMDILHHPCMGLQHPILLKWSMTPPHHIQYLLPLLKTYHALFSDQTATEKIIYQFSLLNHTGQRMQIIQNQRQNLAQSLEIFDCLRQNQQRILQEPVFSRTAAEKIFLQQCQQYCLQDVLIHNHRHCTELLCSVIG